ISARFICAWVITPFCIPRSGPMRSGLALVTVASKTTSDFIGFLVLGLLAIIAAITYTVGTRPYGYIGLGDISVLVFFGWLSVMGSWYLQAHTVIPALFLPATACGLLATAVLNINNLRDIDSDRENGKNTLAVRLGPVNARRYHACLLIGALVCLALFNLISLQSLWGWLFVLAAPLLIKQARFVMRELSPSAMPPMLERTVKGALLTNLLFVIGIVLSQTLR
ncbi:1,4-dihydroxy-2-naphthoate octaprenyltransferase, partial [Enterobacter asburiae]|uniref:1,4-dihydroxy-2-naphthoate octaprenyltransferase n=1 Tax=Enterobacter asburiae TaxID=61645 RepID=UPI001E37983E